MSDTFRRRKTGSSSPGYEQDVEAGFTGAGRSDSTAAPKDNSDPQDLGEYAVLERYISTYREDGNIKYDDEHDKKRRKKRWWQFWIASVDPDQSTTAREKDGVPDSWLETDLRAGLTASDVETRRKVSGWNELAAESENLFAKFLGFFTGPILYGKPRRSNAQGINTDVVLVMELAALLAAGLNDWVDFGVICGILALNAFVGFYQEKQAADVVASLKGDIAMRCTAVREGHEQEILARELVPGDIVRKHLYKYRIL